MNWIEELYRSWWEKEGHLIGAPKAPSPAPNRWVNDVYKIWRDAQPLDSKAPQLPW